MANWFGIGKKSEVESTASPDIGAVTSVQNKEHPMFKAYIPEFLYKPPFGYPRKENLPLIRELAKNPYIYSIIKTLCDEIASTEFSIDLKEDVDMTPELEEIKKKIDRFFHNPNGNKESFQSILRAVTKDILETDSGVMVKVYNGKGEFTQLYARDGASILKNPDIYGYMGNRDDYVEPVNINYSMTPDNPEYPSTLKQYEFQHKESAAYFQYGWTSASLPVPFGKREIVYIMQNPRTDSIYGLSPIQILADVIMTLVYGSNYNLDFYMNNNMPEGIVTLLNANQKQVDAFRERMDKETRVQDKRTGFWRKLAFKVPITNTEAKFTPFQLDPKTMQVLEQQEWFTKIAWMSFGVTADEMGFTENSNKATGEAQIKVSKRKALRPLLMTLKYHIDMEILSEWGELATDSFEFCWDNYDLDEDIKQHALYKQQIDMGIKTPEMIAGELGIDFSKVKEHNEAKELERQQSSTFPIDKDNKPDLKALTIKKGSTVKVVGNHATLSGKMGQVTEIKDNVDECVYVVTFDENKKDMFFGNEIKVIDIKDTIEQVPEKVGEIEMSNIAKLKSDETELEKEFVKVLKTRANELNKALDMYKNGQLEKIE